MDSEKIRNVDLGFQEIKLHSEASFSPARPEIIWFYCLKPPKENSGKTTYCDGIIELWEKLSGKTKKIFFTRTCLLFSKNSSQWENYW